MSIVRASVGSKPFKFLYCSKEAWMALKSRIWYWIHSGDFGLISILDSPSIIAANLWISVKISWSLISTVSVGFSMVGIAQFWRRFSIIVDRSWLNLFVKSCEAKIPWGVRGVLSTVLA